jgi:hypothetical protein
MRYETIADIYSANEKIREQFIATINSVAPDEATARSEGEKWSIQQIVEHVSMVDQGAARICARLLDAAKAAGKPSDGTLPVSASFGEMSAAAANQRLEAPERVQPTGDVTIAEAAERMRANRAAFDAMRSDMELFDASEPKFPHPYFGDMTAAEWLIVAGLHERRHAMQIERLLGTIRQ